MVTTAPASVILIRIAVGAVFLSEGTQKFLFPNELAAGRFLKIGIPAPEVMGPFVGTVEVVCGSLIILGLLTRLAAIPLIINMCVALISTKLPILLGHGFWRFSLSKLPSYGFWSMAHEARTDFAMLLGSIFLLIVGAGAWSLDARLASNGPKRDEKPRWQALILGAGIVGWLVYGRLTQWAAQGTSRRQLLDLPPSRSAEIQRYLGYSHSFRLTLDLTPESIGLLMAQSGIQIGDLAKRAGVTVDTVRFYERRRLLPRAPRSGGGFRLFGAEVVERIRFISLILLQCRLKSLTLASNFDLFKLQALVRRDYDW
jgi:putative oxidoreductase